jgi:hypothetical protein
LIESDKRSLSSLFDFEKNTNAGRAANFRSTLSTIATLSSSNNKTLFDIGKAAAIAQGTIDGIAATQKALASAPPPFNFALAALVGVASAANLAKIASAKPPSFQNSGIVPGQPPIGGGDNTQANVSSGELILDLAKQDVVADRLSGGNDIIQVNLMVGERELASTIVDLKDRGFQI